jgi:hypothetical protein
MAFKTYRIRSYAYRFDARSGGPGGLQLFDSDRQERLSIGFVSDSAQVPSPTLGPNLETATAYFKLSALSGLVDMLRNEDPVSVTINNQPPGFVFIHTGLEPSGVGDEAILAGTGYMP